MMQPMIEKALTHLPLHAATFSSYSNMISTIKLELSKFTQATNFQDIANTDSMLIWSDPAQHAQLCNAIDQLVQAGCSEPTKQGKLLGEVVVKGMTYVNNHVGDYGEIEFAINSIRKFQQAEFFPGDLVSDVIKFMNVMNEWGSLMDCQDKVLSLGPTMEVRVASDGDNNYIAAFMSSLTELQSENLVFGGKCDAVNACLERLKQFDDELGNAIVTKRTADMTKAVDALRDKIRGGTESRSWDEGLDPTSSEEDAIAFATEKLGDLDGGLFVTQLKVMTDAHQSWLGGFTTTKQKIPFEVNKMVLDLIQAGSATKFTSMMLVAQEKHSAKPNVAKLRREMRNLRNEATQAGCVGHLHVKIWAWSAKRASFAN